MKYPKVSLGRVEAVWNKLGGEKGVDRLLSGELIIYGRKQLWREQEGVIYFPVVSDDTTGPEWIKFFKEKDCFISEETEEILNSPDFKPTRGVVYNIAVLRGYDMKKHGEEFGNICSEAKRSGWLRPHPEVACLIRKMFSHKDGAIDGLGLGSIIVAHNPIEIGSREIPHMLKVDSLRDVERLGTIIESSAFMGPHGSGTGFAFAVPQSVQDFES